MWWVSVVVWYMPVKNADRLGAQTGEVENTRVYRMPSLARESTFGVRTFFAP